MSMFYDMDGQPMELMAWAALSEDVEARTVARTAVGSMLVLTVWLGMDQEGDEPPLIFGSVIRISKDADKSEYAHEIRTSTRGAALVAHEHLVEIAEGLVSAG